MARDYTWQDLLKAHKVFTSIENRYKFYEEYMSSRDKDIWLRKTGVPVIEAIKLFGWIHSWDPNFQMDIVKFMDLYPEIFPHLELLKKKTIITVKIDVNFMGTFSSIFNRIALCNRKRYLESTDTSKLLHAIVPDLFVMWDKKIREKLVTGVQENEKYDGSVYVSKFLPVMQSTALKALNSYINEFGGNLSKAVVAIENKANGTSIAKLLDEMNYVLYTKGVSFTEIQKQQL